MKRLNKKFEKFDKKWGKLLLFMFVLVFFFFSFNYYWVSYHNLDLLSNYNLIYNDLNNDRYCGNESLNVRDIQDCNGLFQCPDYKTIYITSMNTQHISIIMMSALILTFMVYIWIPKK